MYHVKPFMNHWVIKHYIAKDFIFGPFETEGDAHFICEMLNTEKITVNFGVEHNGKEDTEESHTIHKHA